MNKINLYLACCWGFCMVVDLLECEYIKAIADLCLITTNYELYNLKNK